MIEAAASVIPARSGGLPAPARLRGRLARIRAPLFYALRLWAAVSLALFLAFWLQMGQPSWAGTSAVIASLPQVGASLRKGWFRVVGTLLGAATSVALAALFPQNREVFLLCVALWGALSAFMTTLLRNFAAYSAALAGYTLAIIVSGAITATGGFQADAVFDLAVSRASEIILGIGCAAVLSVLMHTGDAKQRLVSLIAGLAAALNEKVLETLALPVAGARDMQAVRRDLARRVIDLDPVIDNALGESSRTRYHAAVLQRTVDGLFGALVAWRAIGVHLAVAPEGEGRREADAVLRCIAGNRTTDADLSDPAIWIVDPGRLRRGCLGIMERLASFPTDSPSQKLLADKTAEMFSAMSYVLNGLLLMTDVERPETVRRHKRLRIPDVLPAVVNAVRAFVAIGAAALLWIVTGWPGGAAALVFVMIIVILQGPRGEQAYGLSLLFTLGTAAVSLLATFVGLIVLPAIPTSFTAFSLTLGVFMVPFAMWSMMAKKPWQVVTAAAMLTSFLPLLGPANVMSYDAVARFNQTVVIVLGCLVATLAFWIIPPLSPAFVTRRLLRLTRDDLHCLAAGREHVDWSDHILGRLVAMPQASTPLQRAQLVVALSVGDEIVQLRSMASRLGLDAAFDGAMTALRRCDSAGAVAHLTCLDDMLSQRPATQIVLHARAGILVLTEALREHRAFFDAEEPQ